MSALRRLCTRAVSHPSGCLRYHKPTDPRRDSGAMGRGALLQAMTRAQFGHWLPVVIMAAAAVVAFLAALDLSLTLPVDME